MAENENYEKIEVALKETLERANGDARRVNMRVFCENQGFDYKEAASVIRTSSELPIKWVDREQLLSTFPKPEEEEKLPAKCYADAADMSKRKRKKIRAMFWSNPKLTVQEFLAHQPEGCQVTEKALREILGELWEERYEYKKPRKDWDSYVEILRSLPESKSVASFCREQGLKQDQFKKNCPPDLYEAHSPVRINWELHIEALKSGDISYQEYCKRNNIRVQSFCYHCDAETLERFDEAKMRDRERAAKYDPEKTVRENAQILGVTEQYMSLWIKDKLQVIDPEKYGRIHEVRKENRLTDEEKKILALEAMVETLRKKNLEKESENALLRSKISSLETSNAALRGGKEALNRELLDLKHRIKENLMGVISSL